MPDPTKHMAPQPAGASTAQPGPDLHAPAPGPPAQSDIMLKRLAEVLAKEAPAAAPAQAKKDTEPGGRFIRGGRLQGGKHMGGAIVDANGETLATFEDSQENTGDPKDGKKPEKAPA